jgi:predicted GIY-YIG superfamily endonuclease
MVADSAKYSVRTYSVISFWFQCLDQSGILQIYPMPPKKGEKRAKSPTNNPQSNPKRRKTSEKDDDDDDDDEATDVKRVHSCYLLAGSNQTYVGYTVNPFRRVRQHNRLLKSGGAKRTKAMKGVARFVCIVEPFQDKKTALQYVTLSPSSM